MDHLVYFVQFDVFAQSESLEVTCFDCRMLAVVRILWISYIHLLEIINGQALFKYWLYVFQLIKWWVRGVLLISNCRVVPTNLTGLYVWGLTLSKVMGFIPLQLSSCNHTPEFLRASMLRIVNPIGGCTFPRRCMWGSYSLKDNWNTYLNWGS